MFVAYFAMGYVVLGGNNTVFVSILFSWCASVGSGVLDSVCSISFVKSSKFSFL